MPSTPPRPSDALSEDRIRVVREFGVLDTPPDPVFDDLTALAAEACGTPISLISLLDEDRQWFRSHHGISLSETPLSFSFCVHATRESAPVMVVPDTRTDARFADNPLVKGEPHVRFYAGSPLRTVEGVAIGTLCVADVEPRVLAQDQVEALQRLARQAMSQLELRRALHKIRQEEERYRYAARAICDVIWDWDLTWAGGNGAASRAGRGRELWWSEGFGVALGYAPEEAPATMAAWMELLHPDDRGRVLEQRRRVLATREAAWHDDYRVRRKSGDYAVVHDRASVLRDGRGVAYRMCGGLRDLTELRQVEEQALRARRLEGLGALAGGIAHDLNNALTPVLMATEMLRVEGEDRSAENGLLETIAGGTRRAAELVQQFASFARGVQGPREALRLRGVLLDVAMAAVELFPHSIQIRRDVADDLWPVRGNAAQLHQALMNLLVNARDAMPAGGTITLTARNAHLPVESCSPFKRKDGAYVVIEVQDTGAGMSAEMQDRCFEPFFTTKPPGHGSGLGLSTMHGIVTSHGGFVRVVSEEGRGSTFRVCLPADLEGQSRPTVPVASTPRARAPKRGRGERVLVVDDEETIRFVAGRALEGDGYTVVTATDGQDALRKFRAEPGSYALVVMDMMMPIMDGITCVSELRKIRPEVPIIVASGGVRPSFHRSLPEGLPFLPKPYAVLDLLTMVRETIDRTGGGER